MTAINLTITISQEALAAVLASSAASVQALRPHPMAALIAAIQGAAEAPEGGETDLARDFAEMRFAMGDAVAEEERCENHAPEEFTARETVREFLRTPSQYRWRSFGAVQKAVAEKSTLAGDFGYMHDVLAALEADGCIVSRTAPISRTLQYRAA